MVQVIQKKNLPKINPILNQKNENFTRPRQFKTLRLSLTNRCDFKCLYCVDDAAPKVYEKEISLAEQLGLAKVLNHELTLHEIHLTGGEPLLRSNIGDIIFQIKQFFSGRVKLTTNGHQLNKRLPELAKAGLDQLNISLDAMDAEVFGRMAGIKNAPAKLASLIEAIQNAAKTLPKVKINTTVMKGKNESQILPLLDFAYKNKIELRFLELMNMGHLYQDFRQHFFSQKDILEIIQKKYRVKKMERKVSATANCWSYSRKEDDSPTEIQIFGIIANHSESFCHDCDRLRLDATGKIYGCLSSANGLEIKNLLQNKKQLEATLALALLQKQNTGFAGSDLSMQSIGG